MMDETWIDEEADVSTPNPLLAAPPIDSALSMNVALDAEHGLIRLAFSRPTGMVSLTPAAARSMVQALRECANEAERATGARRTKPNGHGRRGRW